MFPQIKSGCPYCIIFLLFSFISPYILQIPLSMASSFSMASSSGPASSSVHDVFINHRGPDVKNTFASHLYRRLRDCGVTAFLDREEMEKGEEFFSQIVHAINGASVHIAIFSQRYAESIWCLKELVLMKNSRATIFPVFYKIEPSVVRWTDKKGAYAEALRGLEQKKIQDAETGEEKPRYSSDTIQEWRNVLYYVAGLDGFTLRGDEDEVKFLDEVVESILKKVPKPPLHVAQYPTGLDLKLQELEKVLLSQQQQEERVEAKVLGIVGVGGVGKTTLAKEFYNSHRLRYNASSFLSDVREVAGRMSIEYLQSQLIQDLKHIEIKIGRHEGMEKLQKHLSLSHALIILDDVDHVSQLEAFLPIKNIISPNSLILVTSRDKHVLKSSRVLESSIYNLEGLDIPQSKELFCSYALPPPEFVELVDLFVTACNGLPLSLKVVGALLCGENERSYWTEQLERLHRILPDEIFEKLRISYDSLYKEDQPIFLDIASFFIGEDMDKGIRIWGMAGLINLRNKCLLEVDTENKIKMHDHIRDMGRKIAEQQTMDLRLWDSPTSIINNLLEQPLTIITEVRGIKMVSSSIDAFRETRMFPFPTKMWGSQISPSKYQFNDSHFPIMRNLQLLATEEDRLEDILRGVRPRHLKWLRWYRTSHSFLPDWIPLKNLKVLEVEGERLNTLWPHQSQGAPLDLRELNIWAPLSEFPSSIWQLKHLERIAIHNPHLRGAFERLPEEFCRLGSLKYLVFKGFSKMVSLPYSLGELTNLQHIDLEGASSLQTLPDSFGKLTRLKHLSLSGCKNLIISNGTLGDIITLEYLNLSSCEHLNELPPQVAHQLSLQELYISGTKLKEFPSVGCNLKVLYLGGYLLETLLPGLGDLKSLKNLILLSSPQLKSLPDSTGELTQLTELTIRNCGIEYLPWSLLKMSTLESLEVSDCPLQEHSLKKEVEGDREMEGETALNKLNSSSNDRCMFGLKRLRFSGTEIRDLYFDEGVCPNLQQLTLSHCCELRQIGGLCRLPKLRDLEISDCPKVEDLSGLETFTALESLIVKGCEKLHNIRGLRQLTKLQTLHVASCREIVALPGVEHLTSLKELYVSGCKKLQSIPGLRQLTKLRTLTLKSCREIEALPSVEHLTSLESLYVCGCEKLQSIPGLGQLTKLRTLNVKRCREIEALPGVEHLTSLERLSVEKLQSIPGLGQLYELRSLIVHSCNEIETLPGVEHLTSLVSFYVSACEKLQSIPGLGQLTKLRTLNVESCHEIETLPGVEHLSSLESLDVSGCEKLQSIPELGQLTKLQTLNVKGCREIEALPGMEHLTSLESLNVSGCEKLQSIPRLGQLTKLRTLNVKGCREIEALPGVEHLTSLEKLNIGGLGKLKSVQWLGQLRQIRVLDVSQCHEIPEMPGLENLTSLKKLKVSGLRKLKRLKGLGQLTQIRKLDVSKCHEISELSGVQHLTSLKKLNINELGKLKSIQWLGQLIQIRELDISECHGISQLSGLEHLTSLEKLNVSGLGKLKSILGLGQLTQIRELDVSECHEISELPGLEHLTFLENLNVSGLHRLKNIQCLGQLTRLTQLNVSKCYELQELQGVEDLMSLEILNACECPELRWREGIFEQLRQQLKEGFTYERQRKRCSCLEFLQFLC